MPEITVFASTVRKAFHPAVLLKAPVPVINVLPARPRDETVNVCKEYIVYYCFTPKIGRFSRFRRNQFWESLALFERKNLKTKLRQKLKP